MRRSDCSAFMEWIPVKKGEKKHFFDIATSSSFVHIILVYGHKLELKLKIYNLLMASNNIVFITYSEV